MIINKTYRRKTFTVQAIQVTDENMNRLAKWCGGQVIVYFPDTSRESGDYRAGQRCVEVVVGNTGDGRLLKSRAYPGDWITCLVNTNNFRVYRNKTFLEAFEEVRSEFEKREAVMAVIEAAITNVSRGELEDLVSQYSDQIMNIID